VIPILSPNNDGRKIQEASRGLQMYILQAKTRAAKTGRPAGIAFRETSAGSGVALDVFQIEVPQPFAGFSSDSLASFYRNYYGNGKPKDSFTIEMGEGYVPYNPEVGKVPPRFLKPGDLIEVGDHLFILKRGSNSDYEMVNGVRYFNKINTFREAFPVPEEDGDRPYPNNSKYRYRFNRQPVNTSASPYTFPAGVAIDMHASGTEGGAEPTLFARSNSIKQIGILFSPTGEIDSIHYNGLSFGPNGIGNSIETPITDASRLYLLLGRVENVLEGQESMILERENIRSEEDLLELQKKRNWLNLESRWVTCDARSGRALVSENAYVNPNNVDEQAYSNYPKDVRRIWAQLDAARQFAKQMGSSR
jgi:hypothetical protein